jgi:hypothetical protein
MRRNYNLPSHVAFVDLFKAYDTGNHELLLVLLKKSGASPPFCLSSGQNVSNFGGCIEYRKLSASL